MISNVSNYTVKWYILLMYMVTLVINYNTIDSSSPRVDSRDVHETRVNKNMTRGSTTVYNLHKLQDAKYSLVITPTDCTSTAQALK